MNLIKKILDGFHKKVSVELGGLKCERDEMEFAHQYFIKDHPYLLEHIKRKVQVYFNIHEIFLLLINLLIFFILNDLRLHPVKLRMVILR